MYWKFGQPGPVSRDKGQFLTRGILLRVILPDRDGSSAGCPADGVFWSLQCYVLHLPMNYRVRKSLSGDLVLTEKKKKKKTMRQLQLSTVSDIKSKCVGLVWSPRKGSC